MVGRPSDVFCGNWVKQADRACTSKATDSNGNRPAQEHVEIRGWIVGVDGPDTPGQHPENEYRFNVLLDHGWTPATPSGAGIFPINTPEAINATITPDNVIWFGQNDSANGPAVLDSNGTRRWGGTRAAVLHVEVNGWGPARMGQAPYPDDWKDFSRNQDTNVKVNGPNANTLVGWPFDPTNPLGTGPLDVCDQSLTNCAYVRLVGTPWEDEPHVRDGTDAVKDAKGCWNSGATGQGGFGRGFFEMHPVDFMARIQRNGARTETLGLIVMCGTSAVDRDFSPPTPPPSPGMTIHFQEIPEMRSRSGRVYRRPV